MDGQGLAKQHYLANMLSTDGLSYADAANSSDMLNGLAKSVAYRDLAASDIPIKDATDQLLVAAQGPKAFTYLSPELTSALRVSNAVSTKQPIRLTGVPTKIELKSAMDNKEAMDRLKWKVTGNGLKANAWSNNYTGE